MSTVEYVILMVFIVVGAVGVWQKIGKDVKDGLAKAKEDTTKLNEGN